LNGRNAFDAAAAVDGWPEKDWQTLLEEESCVLGVSLAGQLLTSWGDWTVYEGYSSRVGVVRGADVSGGGAAGGTALLLLV
jgi:hypothetical protein